MFHKNITWFESAITIVVSDLSCWTNWAWCCCIKHKIWLSCNLLFIFLIYIAQSILVNTDTHTPFQKKILNNFGGCSFSFVCLLLWFMKGWVIFGNRKLGPQLVLRRGKKLLQSLISIKVISAKPLLCLIASTIFIIIVRDI